MVLLVRPLVKPQNAWRSDTLSTVGRLAFRDLHPVVRLLEHLASVEAAVAVEAEMGRHSDLMRRILEWGALEAL